MTKYLSKELVGITEFSKSVSKWFNQLANGEFAKLAIVKKNKPKFVIISVEEYERLNNAEYEEYQEIARIVNVRVDNSKNNKTISHDEMLDYLKGRGVDV